MSVCLRAFNSFDQCWRECVRERVLRTFYYLARDFYSFSFFSLHFNDQFAKQIECVACTA